MRKLARLLGRLLLGLLIMSVSVAIAALLLIRSDWGHRKIVSLLLPHVESSVTGSVSIGRLGGDLTHFLTLEQLVVRDSEGEPAVTIARAEAHYSLAGLLAKRLSISSVKISGATIHARPLSKGQLNLATLVRPSTEETSKPSEFAITIEQVTLDGQIIYELNGRLQRLNATLSLLARGTVRGSHIEANVEAVHAQTTEPMRTSFDFGGSANIQGNDIRLKAVHAELQTDGVELRELCKRLEIHALDSRLKPGQWKASVHTEGSLDALTVDAEVLPQIGQLNANGELNLRHGVPHYAGSLKIRGLDLGAALIDVPQDLVSVDAHVNGESGRGRVDLEKLHAEAIGTQLDAHGSFDFDGYGELAARATATDLSRLAHVVGLELGGSLALDARVHRQQDLDIRATLTGKNLHLGTTHIGSLRGKVDSHDLSGSAKLRATAVQLGKVHYDWLDVDTTGNKRALSARIDGQGPAQTQLHLRAQGVPILSEGRPKGADVTVSTLTIGIRDQEWTLVAPSHIRFDRTFTLEHFQLKRGAQMVSFDGAFDPNGPSAHAHLRTEKLDLNPFLSLFRSDSSTPHTELNSDIVGEFSGAIKRARAKLSMESQGQSLKGTLDVPISLEGNDKLALDLTFSKVNLEEWSSFLPPSLASFRGHLGMGAKISGTTLHPVIDFDLQSSDWELETWRRGTLRVHGEYRDGALNSKYSTRVLSPTGPAGALEGSAAFRFDLSRLWHGNRDSGIRNAPLEATIQVQRLALAKIPWTLVGLHRAPLDDGYLNASLSLTGSIAEPVVRLDLDASDLRRGGFNRIGLKVALRHSANRAKLDASADLRGARILDLQASANIDLGRLGRSWEESPLSLTVRVADYDLSRMADLIPGLSGRIRGELSGSGTLSKPVARATLSCEELSLGNTRFSRFALQGSLDQSINVSLEADQLAGGRLTFEGNILRGGSSSGTAKLTAHDFRFDLQLPSPAPLRLLRGILVANLEVSGAPTGPQIRGDLHFAKGELGIASASRPYQDIAIDVDLQNGIATLSQLALRYGDGTVKGSGHATFSASQESGMLSPKTLSLSAHASHFPVIGGPAGSLIDADLILDAKRENGILIGKVLVNKGSAHLPKVSSKKSLQSTSALADVMFVDSQARHEHEDQERAQSEANRVQLSTRIPEFQIRSKEASIDLKGSLEVDLTSKLAKVSGSVEALGGWVELLGRKYRIERARLGFDGSSDLNPTLDIRVARDITDSSVIIEVHGSAKKPKVKFLSEPAIYDESQVIGIVVSGDPGDQRTSDRSLANQAVGVISNIVIGKLKDQIAPSLPIDVLKVDVAGEGSNPAAQTRLEVGKYLTQSIYVSYVHAFGQQVSLHPVNSNQAQVEYRFARQYTLQTIFGDAQVGGIDLLWRKRY